MALDLRNPVRLTTDEIVRIGCNSLTWRPAGYRPVEQKRKEHHYTDIRANVAEIEMSDKSEIGQVGLAVKIYA